MWASRFFALTLGLVAMQNSFSAVLNIQPTSVNAQAWLIYDQQTQQIIAEHNAHKQHAPASLTKMMVAYIVLKDIQSGKLQKNQIVNVTPIVNQVQDDESQMELNVGEQVSIDQLLAGLTIMSANDAALLLAEYLGNGNMQNFIQRMNQEAQQLGMKNTSFTNPSGVTMEQHYSTAYDLNLLSLALIEQTPDYLNYAKQPTFNYKKIHEATNILLKRDNRIDGLKTGYTSAAGYNLALTATQSLAKTAQESSSTNPTDEQTTEQVNTAHHEITVGTLPLTQRRLVVIVLGTNSKAQRADISYKLLNLAFEYTQNVPLIQQYHTIAYLPIENSLNNRLAVYAPHTYNITASRYPQQNSIDLNQFNLQNMRIQYTENEQIINIEPLTHSPVNYRVIAKQKLIAPLQQQNFALADLEIIQNNQVIQTIPITQDVDIKAMNFLQRGIDNFCRGIIALYLNIKNAF
ncbi:D-alanyl-D-alanine carboxypeptidase family protein [Moraxella sp. ZY210820]|uniref:D-alanyl-D-alanine carboxypeptidase family protein n=2 Tax=unclassified Moraxella TaxID=2685852 RepID=UPI0027306577|nr:D-alanyl-D-alanine carboxypeptidase family protein [Moraxella sp. ZY210820]WLF84288.1 D-alanyl-D-alanine carboxypeptidase [Moraxella sp. ZY210820]